MTIALHEPTPQPADVAGVLLAWRHGAGANIATMSVSATVPVDGQSFIVDHASPDDLYLDDRNPRLHGESDSSQDAILETLWREFAVNEVADSIAANGFFPYEPLFATFENGRWVVVEGNRRLAAVKLLMDQKLRQRLKATDLPALDDAAKDELALIPYVPCTREDVWRYIGFKHVNGPAVWDAMGKAIYIASVHNTYKVSLDDIARQIGDRHTTVARLYQGLMALEQAEDAGVYRRDDRYNKRFFFSHLYTGLGLSGIQQFLGIGGRKKITATKTPIPAAKMRELGDVLLWMYGSGSQRIPPLVKSQNPDLRKLDQALTSRESIAAIRKGVGLDVAVDISKGDDAILREDLVIAKMSLQSARGRVVTGFDGERDLVELGGDIKLLADAIVADMERLAPRRSRGANR
ncbi:MAG: hypothetical protein QOI06_2864 [Nocardioidaceae bacterium]|jgi:hypothetical protein|nr:hypothetical protein [Nocardioidaceae bacterium]